MGESAVSGAPESGVYELIAMRRIGVDQFLGGSPSNVAAAAARLGRRTAMITKTRDDPFGTYLHPGAVPAKAPPLELPGREGVLSGVTGFAYAPSRTRVQIASGVGGRFALAGAKCERRLPARYGPAPEVPVRPTSERIRPPARISLA